MFVYICTVADYNEKHFFAESAFGGNFLVR
jgi:hypothetical protein